MTPSPISASIPLLVLGAALLVFRVPLLKAAPLAYGTAVALATALWRMPLDLLLSSAARGLLLTADILWIVFGALFFLHVLRATPAAPALEVHLSTLSPDRRIQAVIIGWLFGGFLEGSAGFGTPGAIGAPLLVAIGFPVMTAILVVLAANSTAVAFGAVGTPVLIGLQGFDLNTITSQTAAFSLAPGLLVPPLIIWLTVRSVPVAPWRRFLEALPWALWAGVAFLAPFYALSRLGPEFPSLLGAPIGLALVGLSLRWKLFVPKHVLAFQEKAPALQDPLPRLSLRRALTPYVLLIGLLLAGKFIFSQSNWMIELGGGVRHRINLFNPGFAFLTAIAALAIAWRIPAHELRRSALTATRAMGKPLVSLFFVSALVQVMMLSEMIQTLGRTLESTWLPIIAPSIGALGSFLAGSATVSNLLMGPLQFEMAQNLGLNINAILSLQLVGAAAGNMIALPNLLAVQTTVNESGREVELLGKLAAPCLAYLLIAGACGYLFS